VQAQRRRERKAVPQSQWDKESFDLRRLRAWQEAFMETRLAPETARHYQGQLQLFEEFTTKCAAGRSLAARWWLFGAAARTARPPAVIH
jgi:hypothetical protein